MQSAVEHWRKSTEAKLREVQARFDAFLSHWAKYNQAHYAQQIPGAIKELADHTSALMDHFGTGNAPHVLARFHDALTSWRQSPHDHERIKILFSSAERLPEITRYEADQDPAFDSVYEAQKDDEELAQSVETLIKKLEALLSDADADISGKAERDLERILAHLRRWKEHSLVDLTCWLELAARTAAALSDANHGTIWASTSWEIAKLALASRFRVAALYDKARAEFTLKLGMPFLARAEERGIKLPEVDHPPQLTDR